jgi:Uma2 family endonuclease
MAMPTSTHQAVLASLYDLFNTYLKPRGYAEARIPEYWIVDPRDEVITVLTPRGDAYVESGVYEGRSTATSPLLDSFYADVSAVFDAPKSTT